MSGFNVTKISLLVLISIAILVGPILAGNPAGDVNSSGEVNIGDLEILAGQWLDGPGCVGHPDDCADLVGDDGVNIADFGIMSENWLQQWTPTPPAPSLILPANESNVAGTNIDFSWSTSAGANNYYLQVADDVGFSSLTYDGVVGNTTSINLGDFPTDGTRFYWHVKAGYYAGDPFSEDLISDQSTQWHYRKGQSEPPSNWRELGFTEDGTWHVGQTIIGFSNRGEFEPGTELTDMYQNYYTVYARHSFELDTPPGYELDTLTLRLFIDDGCIVSINNEEVHRFNVSDGPKYYNSFNGLDYLNPSWTQEELTDISSLVEGTNVLAMHVLNNAANSSDLAIEAELIANFVPTGVGGWSEYSPTWYFDNGTVPIPSVPGLSLPANESKVGGTNIAFSWSASAFANDYYLQVATNSGFVAGSLIYNGAVGNTTSINLGSFPYDGTKFYWHVRAGNASGWSAYSTAWCFYNEDPPLPPEFSLKINEFVASNSSTVSHFGNRLDEFGNDVYEFEDWIEIYNAGDVAVDIGGKYLTDNLSNPMKWQIPDDSPSQTTIASGDYLLIWADGEPDEGVLHVDFQIGKDDGEIGLFDSDGITLIDSVIYDQQVTDISFGRYPNAGANWRYYGNPTPEAGNTGTVYLGVVADPEFSVRRGFHEEAFNVVLTCPTPGATIYYTFDSTDPTESSTLYSGPVAVSTTTCLRARAFRTDYLPSVIITHTYIYVDEVIAHPDMVTDITQDPVWGPQIYDALLEIPTISLVTPYTIPDYPLESPPEVPVSIEMIFPDGSKGFQANAGVERFGREYTVWEKQALRVSFKNIYGPSRLEFDLFSDTPYGGDDATKSFNQIILRNGSHDSLFYGGYTSWGIYSRGRYCYDRQFEMGHISLRGRFVHMYQNGNYRGLYDMFERPTADYMSQYLGGEEEDYDIVKGRGGLQYMEGDFMPDGTLESWDYMKANLNNYEIAKDYIDIDNLIDYLILNFYGGNDHDWYGDHNWVAGRKREPGGKWKFFMWDNDFLFRILNADTTDNGTPSDLYDSLRVHAEFRVRMGDRAQKHFFNGGMLTPARVQADFTELASRIERVVIPECARWCEVAKTAIENAYPPDFTYTPTTFQDSVDWIKFTWAPVRTNTVLTQMRNDGVFPSINAPTFSQHGGEITPAVPVSITAPTGTIYYTIDGADPRLTGGAINTAHAIVYTVPINFTKSTCLKARAKSGGTWSALNEAVFAVGPVVGNLRITEIMYNPADLNAEYIELKNIGGNTINIGLVRFTNGIDFTFPSHELTAGKYVLVAQDPTALAAVASIPPGVGILGPYTGLFDNGGEKIELVDAIGRTIHEFDYEDGWYEITDGIGFSLTIKDPTDADLTIWDDKAGWRPSASIGGSPGEDDSGQVPELGAIKINELLAHSDVVYAYDWVELYNTTGAPINIGGWYLSDDNNNLKKYTIPNGTSIGAYGYCVFYENLHFGVGNPADPANVPFALSENGETLYLNSGQGGVLTGYSEEEAFDASQADVPFGRYQKSTGTFNFVAMSSPTPGWANAYPKVGPIVISEIMYNPLTEGDAEYVELLNISGSTVTLQEWDPVEGINVPWRFTDSGGIMYDFPLGTTMNAGEKILLVKNLIVFEMEFGGSVPGDKFEWGEGKLDNGGEKIELSMPGDLEGLIRYYIQVDRINYSDGTHPVGDDPWPTGPDGTGQSLTRKVPSDYGNDVDNWQSATPSPGG